MSEQQGNLQKAIVVDKKLATIMIRTYAEASQRVMPFTRSVWFPIDKINTLFTTMNSEGANGVRIYFGIYTEQVINELNKEPGAEPIPLSYAGRVTVIFVSTKDNSTTTGEDYFLSRLFTDPENRGLLCPPKTECDCNSDLVFPKPANCQDAI